MQNLRLLSLMAACVMGLSSAVLAADKPTPLVGLLPEMAENGVDMLLVHYESNGAYVLSKSDVESCGGKPVTPRNLYDAVQAGYLFEQQGSSGRGEALLIPAFLPVTFSWCGQPLPIKSPLGAFTEGTAYVCADVRSRPVSAFVPTGGCATVDVQWQSQYVRFMSLPIDELSISELVNFTGVGINTAQENGEFVFGLEIPGQLIGYRVEVPDSRLNLEACRLDFDTGSFAEFAAIAQQTERHPRGAELWMRDCAGGEVGTTGDWVTVSLVCAKVPDTANQACVMGLVSEFTP